MPEDFRVTLLPHAHEDGVVYGSKAVGEPPLMLAISVFCALTDAVHALSPGRLVALDAPATPEAILLACEAVRGRAP
jgi:xanthine dehydrogenase large subunit